MVKTDLKIINDDNGSVYHGMKKDDAGFDKFGEVYFSTVKMNKVKAWKLHKRMILNLIVPIGKIKFVFLDNRKKSETYNKYFKIILSQDSYARLTVPANIWFGFKGMDEGVNLICNIANISHDPLEVIRKDLNQIKMDWSKE